MRWKIQKPEKKKSPKLGDIKNVIKFAYLPRFMEDKNDEHWLWLEKYRCFYEYKRYNGPADHSL